MLVTRDLARRSPCSTSERPRYAYLGPHNTKAPSKFNGSTNAQHSRHEQLLNRPTMSSHLTIRWSPHSTADSQHFVRLNAREQELTYYNVLEVVRAGPFPATTARKLTAPRKTKP